MASQLPTHIIVDNREYSLGCEPHERELLINASEFLDDSIRKLRDDNPQMATEKVYVLAGLDMAFRLLQERKIFAGEVSMVNRISEVLLSQLDQTVSSTSHYEED